MPMTNTIFNEREIFEILERTARPPNQRVLEVIQKARGTKGLTLKEVGCLINSGNETLPQLFETAKFIKNQIYGERLVFFAPLYVSSFCVNDCAYCGFHLQNKAPRKKLTLEEIKQQTEILVDMGHKRLLLEFGEDPKNNPIDYVVEVIKTIYATKVGRGEIRRVNVNLAATSIDDYKKLKATGIGTYQLFQETYHYDTYQNLHHGPKADFIRQLTAHDRAFEAGIDDLGIGVLFGLYDWRFEALALVAHAEYLDKTHGVGPHTISVPRFRPAPTVNFRPPWPVSDEDFLKLIAILRLAVPYAGMIISTRETPELRERAFTIGISQTSAGSRTSPGGYGKEKTVAQFNISDGRPLDAVLKSVMEQGLLPSFCTACYRSGRTGDKFMEYAKSGNIQNFCRPNALLTFKEYLEDYADSAIKIKGEQVINQYLSQIPNEIIRARTEEKLKMIESGLRDLYF